MPGIMQRLPRQRSARRPAIHTAPIRTRAGIPFVLAAAAGWALLAAPGARAQIANWNNPLGGDWSVAANWAPQAPPNSLTAVALLNLAGTYTVTLPVHLPDQWAVSTLNVGNVGTTLDMIGPMRFESGITNNGVILIESNSSIQCDTTLVSLSGPGRIVLNSVLNSPAAYITGAAANVLNHLGDHTIQGTGLLFVNMNNGVWWMPT
jgi:hypothetical protein